MNPLRWPLMFFRLVVQSMSLAAAQIWANKFRSMLTTLGIVIGVASVTAVIAALTGLRTNVLTEFEAFGVNKMFIVPDWSQRTRMDWRKLLFKPEQFDGLLDHCPDVADFTRFLEVGIEIESEAEKISQARLFGIDPSWHAIENRHVTLGRPFSLIDEGSAARVCLITADLRDELRLPIDCVGKTILVGPWTYRIIGLVEARVKGAMFGERGRNWEVYVPFQTLYRTHRHHFRTVVAISRSPEKSDEARAQIRFFLRKTRQLAPEDPDTFELHVIKEHLEKFNTIALTMTLVASGVVGISLLVGGIGIMNIMLVSVSERTREIGLRKAVGARPSAILLQFLVESVMVCFLGGAIGVLGGEGLTALLALIPEAKLDQAHIPLWAVGMSFGFAAAVGIVFGMFPAIKAARLNPIEALRHE
ncbi:MAG: ABC transporter permease [Phycisphaerae bacterium]|nr:ABC transporter permease [Phycisphaerae bacterium]